MNKSKPFPSHLLSLSALSTSQLQLIFDRADYYLKNGVDPDACFDTLRGKAIVLLLFEPSTRTRLSFEIAAHRLGAIVLSPDVTLSSLKKMNPCLTWCEI